MSKNSETTVRQRHNNNSNNSITNSNNNKNHSKNTNNNYDNNGKLKNSGPKQAKNSVKNFDYKRFSSEQQWWLAFGFIVIASFGTRLYKISEPNHVCWDETHFGKMGSWYINNTFFFDVHPPLGKMLIGLSGYLTGYNGTFAFNKPGDSYEDYPILGMRIFCVFLGTLIVPFSFVIVWHLSKSIGASFLGASFLLYDIGMITLSQYILLDPILICFIVGSTMGMVAFKSQRDNPFGLRWWFWLLWTGVFISCSTSVKFVGLFVVLLVGIYTAFDLWELFSNLENSMLTMIKHFVARAVCLIALPIALYTFFFWIHLSVLHKTGSGDGFYSSAFQSTLEGNSLHNASMPRYVAFGALITMKNHRTGGAYLHSHWHLYPEGVGARQQQVTSYSHKDDNNKWKIKKYNEESSQDNDPIEFVKNGDLVRLEHIMTGRNLHSHQESAPITKKHYQVTCYGEKGIGDANDVFRIEFESGKAGDRLEAVKTRFKLVHYLMNCAVYSHNKQLPKWGFEQLEVACTPNVFETKNTLWNVEDNHFERLPNVSVNLYAPSFVEKFVESHAVMFQGNAGLKPKEGEVTSRPWQWPINYRGQFFSGNDFKIYLLGNPIIWWLNFAFLFLYLFTVFVILVRQRRQCDIDDKELVEENRQFLIGSSWLFLGWSLHYIPFYGMGRILYFHHYFPAAIYSSMLTAMLFNYYMKILAIILRRSKAGAKLSQAGSNYLSIGLYSILYLILVWSFYLFSPLTYGITRSGNLNNSTVDSLMDSTGETASASESMDYSSEQSMASLRWMDSWEF